MASKDENRAKLQGLRGIIDSKLTLFPARWQGTGDGAVAQVVSSLREALDEMDPPQTRGRRGGRDRMEREGHDRGEG